jgi:hypothetical protein
MSRPQVLQNLREALVNNRAMAIELLADVLIQQGFVQASALFTAANGVAIAPGVWQRRSPKLLKRQKVLSFAMYCKIAIIAI